MADQGTQGTSIPAPMKGANEGGRPADTGKGNKNTEGCACEPVGILPTTPVNNVKPR